MHSDRNKNDAIRNGKVSENTRLGLAFPQGSFPVEMTSFMFCFGVFAQHGDLGIFYLISPKAPPAMEKFDGVMTSRKALFH